MTQKDRLKQVIKRKAEKKKKKKKKEKKKNVSPEPATTSHPELFGKPWG